MKKREITSLFCLITLMVASVGCQKNISPLSRLMVSPDTAEAMNYRIDWQTNISIPYNQKIKHLETLGDKIVTLETGNVISVINADTGRLQWRDRIGGKHEKMARPVRDNDMLIISSETRAFVYDINEGTFVKVVPLSHFANTAPVIIENLAIYGTPKGVVFAQDLRSGLKKWAYKMGNSVTTDPISAGPSVVTTDATGEVNLFNPVSGGIIWEYNTWGRISVKPAASELLLYVASEDQTLYCLERTTGKVRWKLPTSNPLLQSPVALGDIALQWVREKGLVALDSFTGKELWVLNVNARPVQVQKDNIIFHHEGKLLYVDRKDGAIVKTVDIRHVHHIKSEKIDGGTLIFARDTGRIMKLSPK